MDSNRRGGDIDDHENELEAEACEHDCDDNDSDLELKVALRARIAELEASNATLRAAVDRRRRRAYLSLRSHPKRVAP